MATSVVVGLLLAHRPAAFWKNSCEYVTKQFEDARSSSRGMRTPHRSTDPSQPHPQPSGTVPNLGLRLIRRGAPLPRSDLATHTHVPYF